MDIRNSVEGLKTLLGVPSTAPAKTQGAKGETASSGVTLAGDRATLSSAGAEAAQSLADSDVRMDKVAAVQAALAAGTYSVPASAVAGKVVDAMMGGGSSSEN